MSIKADSIQRVDGQTTLSQSGAILQVVQVKYVMPYYHYENINNSLFEIIPLRIQITPKETTSKILVQWSFRGNADSSYNRMEFFIYRQINSGSNANLTSGNSGNSAGQAAGQWPLSGGGQDQIHGVGGIDYLDDPSFSSGDKITYKLYVRDGNNDGSAFSINRGRNNLSNNEETVGASSVTAFEISQTS